MNNWTAEDEKLVTLAKGARSRVTAKSSAALRDTTGRTYASAEVDKSFLSLSAVEITVAQAIASGAAGIEAIVICSEKELTAHDRSIITNFAGPTTSIYLVDLQGQRIDSN
jgi:cytidine deaminase